MRRVPFFYLACCLQTNLMNLMKKKKGRSVKLDKWEKSKIGAKSTAHSQKQKRKKKEKKDRRRHIDVTSVAIVLRSTTVF